MQCCGLDCDCQRQWRFDAVLAATTHEEQPLDCSVFSPLKAQWRKVCNECFQSHPVIFKFNFVILISKAWLQAVTPSNLISGLWTCGIFFLWTLQPFKLLLLANQQVLTIPKMWVITRLKIRATISILQLTILHLLESRKHYLHKGLKKDMTFIYDADYAQWLKEKHPEVLFMHQQRVNLLPIIWKMLIQLYVLLF